MSGLAQILDNLGYRVSGTDARDSAFLQTLQARGIDARLGHNPALVDGAGLVVRTAAIKQENPEYVRALELQIPVIERSELLGIVCGGYRDVVGISGCHGKTTITSMLALITDACNLDATVHVGGMVDFLSGGVKLGQSDIFITEACEYVRSFLTLHPRYILINNIDDDHLDYYKNIDEIIETFRDFVRLLPEDGKLFLCADDPAAMSTASSSKAPIITYGVRNSADFEVKNTCFDEMGNVSFDAYESGGLLGHVKLNVPGAHNAANALGAIAIATRVFHLPFDHCAKALENYHLAGRRFELFGERDGVKLIHDYAHHPSEIKACLAAAKRYPHKKLWVVFQCNSFTRARTLKDKYGLAFDDADTVLMPDLYPGRDIDRGDIHAKDLVAAINAHSGNCIYLPTFENIRDYLRSHWQSGDIVVTLGSGDVNKQQLILLK